MARFKYRPGVTINDQWMVEDTKRTDRGRVYEVSCVRCGHRLLWSAAILYQSVDQKRRCRVCDPPKGLQEAPPKEKTPTLPIQGKEYTLRELSDKYHIPYRELYSRWYLYTKKPQLNRTPEWVLFGKRPTILPLELDHIDRAVKSCFKVEDILPLLQTEFDKAFRGITINQFFEMSIDGKLVEQLVRKVSAPLLSYRKAQQEWLIDEIKGFLALARNTRVAEQVEAEREKEIEALAEGEDDDWDM